MNNMSLKTLCFRLITFTCATSGAAHSSAVLLHGSCHKSWKIELHSTFKSQGTVNMCIDNRSSSPGGGVD